MFRAQQTEIVKICTNLRELITENNDYNAEIKPESKTIVSNYKNVLLPSRVSDGITQTTT